MSHATAPIPVLPFTSSLLSCSEQIFGAAPMDTADLGDRFVLSRVFSKNERHWSIKHKFHRNTYDRLYICYR